MGWYNGNSNLLREFVEWIIRKVETTPDPVELRPLLKKVLLLSETIRAVGIKGPDLETLAITQGDDQTDLLTYGDYDSPELRSRITKNVTKIQEQCNSDFMSIIN